MDRNEAASVIQKYLICVDIAFSRSCSGKCAKCRYYTSDEEVESALKLAIEVLRGEADGRFNQQTGGD